MTKAGQIKPDSAAGAYEQPAFEGKHENRQKPSRAACKLEARRLMGKSFGTTDAVVVGVIVDAIQTAAHNEGHCQRIVTWLLYHIDRWPDVPDVREAAYQTRDSEERANPDCEICGGCGYAPSTRVINGVRYEGSRRCACWRYVKVTP